MAAKLFAMVVLTVGGVVLGDPVACSGEDGSCPAEAEDGTALLQTADMAGCAYNGQDPYHNKNGHCCYQPDAPLYKVKNTWYSHTCSFRCMHCSTAGQDPRRYCNSHCSGHHCREAQVPCCPGLVEVIVNGKATCKEKGHWGPGSHTSSCAGNGQDPFAPGKNHECCSNTAQPLYKVLGKWSGQTCSYRCKQCSGYGEDTHRYCGSHCGGCKPGGSELLPCCPHLKETLVNGKYKCMY